MRARLMTMVGEATILHRLRVGVECIDGFRDSPVVVPVRAGWECDPARRPRPLDATWPCVDLEAVGRARFRIGDSRPLPTQAPLVIRVDDPSRHYVPRRFAVDPWPLDLLQETDGQGLPQPYVPVRSRVLRSWMLPGAAYSFPRGTTVVRGRITRLGGPARWARVFAIGPTNDIAGRAHADDLGEFVLVIADPGQNPVRSRIPIELNVVAPRDPASLDEKDPCAGLVAEEVPRSSAPPLPDELDNDLLRGAAMPPGYAFNSQAATAVSARAGEELVLSDVIEFEPNP